ncbi:olfactory receptor 1G1-like [Pleurodeles waltl]|uniref:olfactory receptor 1G1-like n=1 Tax=Pleurodeles waltl TaxID=8319 RepID=UPI003709B218
MKQKNITSVADFFIVGFSDLPQMQVPLFVLFSIVYLLAFVGNLLIMATIFSSSHLHIPMYFFLTNLSFLDISYTSVIFPKMLSNFFLKNRHISFAECLLQMYFFLLMVSTELFLLTVMAYDRYVAICRPLHYMTIMTKSMCFQLVSGSWAVSSMVPLAHTILMSKLTFCEPHRLNHFFCDVTALLEISCSSTHMIETTTYILGLPLLLLAFFLIITSSTNIVLSIIKIQSKGGRYKAFSTCASHLTVVILFFGSLGITYARPASTYSMKGNKVMSLVYIVVSPLFNPIVYGLRNTDFKNALQKKKHSS